MVLPVLAAALIAASIAAFHGDDDVSHTDMAPQPPHSLATTPVPVPSAQQLQWQDLEVAAMLGWNLQTICMPKRGTGQGTPSTQKCQASSKTEGPLYVPTREQVANWNPSAIDTDEWVRVSASFGAKYIVMVADHMSGFTWWDTKYHNYSIAHTKYKDGGADLVRELLASCRRYNVKLGFFYSVHFNWYLGVDGYKVGHPPLGPRQYTQDEYLEIAKGQLREIIQMFGEEGPLEIWFDGGTGPSAAAIGPVVHANAPNAVCHSCYDNFTNAGSVRWMGNEQGMMPLPSWGGAAGDGSQGDGGNPLADAFMPPSTDVVLREHYWFYQDHTEASTKTTKMLVQNYLTSVGRASNLILNVAPDGTGKIPNSDVQRYAEMGKAISCLFSKPVAKSPIVVRSKPSAFQQFICEQNLRMLVVDTGERRGYCYEHDYWLHRVKSAKHYVPYAYGFVRWQLPLGAEACSNCSLVIREDQTAGQLIGNYTLQCQHMCDNDCSQQATSKAGPWSTCEMGELPGVISNATHLEGVGHKRIFLLNVGAPLVAIRLAVFSHYATGHQTPGLRDFSLYDWGAPEIQACV